jgi:orotidine-5'-phosphate decarboxylase
VSFAEDPRIHSMITPDHAAVETSGLVSPHPADSMLAAIDRVGAPVCVGIDPVLDRLPEACLIAGEPLPSIERFCRGVVEAVAPSVGVCKYQSACFERYGSQGVALLEGLLAHAAECGLEVILDAKRGDIGISAEHYAAAVRGRAPWVTVNAYLGTDGIEPFLEHGGAFALARTSNPGGDALQRLELADGRTIAEAVADLLAEAGDSRIGDSGYSALGAVVGATKRADAEMLRSRMPRQLFLVPGYGAQGGGVDDVLPCFNADGRGAVITASRSVIYAFKNDTVGAWTDAVTRAAERFSSEIAAGLGRG